MDYTTLGRTGLKVSVLGLGCGGPSRLGTLTGHNEAEAVAVVEHALDLGVNFLDTAELYETESIVGRAIQRRNRDQIVVSTKKTIFDERGLIGAEEVRRGLEQSLVRLNTDFVDVYHAHGIRPHHYEYVREEIVPCLLALRREGKIRFLGLTERFVDDPQHAMLARAARDDCWDVMMAGFNLLNPSARRSLLPITREKGIGVVSMIGYRQEFHRPERLIQRLRDGARPALIERLGIDPEAPLGFLTRNGGAASLPEAAYRFCRWEPGVHVVLCGTGSREHLEANAAAIVKPPLPEEDLRRLRELAALLVGGTEDS
jgi:aryl-alcohol dehydrogenase-like predicted oxidoreductase